MSSVLGVVEQLKVLCSNPQNQPYIARRGILAGLVGFLQHLDTHVVLTATETIHLLAECPENIPLLHREPNLIDSLTSLFKTFHSAQSTQEQLKICNEAAAILVLCGVQEKNAELKAYASRHNLPVDAQQRKSHTDPQLNKARDVARLTEEAVSEGQKRVNCVLFFSGTKSTDHGDQNGLMKVSIALSMAQKRRLEQVLLGTKGVLSFSWLDGFRLSIFTFLIPEKLAAIVRIQCDLDVIVENQELDIIAHETRSNVLRESSAHNIYQSPSKSDQSKPSANDQKPKYLSKEDIEKLEKQQRIQNARTVLTAQGDDSLAARIARMRSSAHNTSGTSTESTSGVRGFFSRLWT